MPGTTSTAPQFDWLAFRVGRPSAGVTGVSVECAEGVSVEELAGGVTHRQIGVITVRTLRAAGGGVVRTSGRSPYHATVIGLSPEEASRLLTPTIPNPCLP